MCMKNVNLNAVFCDIISNADIPSISLANIRKKFNIINENDKRVVSQISMAIFIAATQSKDPTIINAINPNLVFSFKEKYEIKVRLTETISGAFKDLSTFVIDPSTTEDSHGLCRSTFNHIQLCLASDISLPDRKEKEKFVVKLLIRRFDEFRSKDDGWNIQSIIPIGFNNL